MQQETLIKGTRRVIATRNDERSKWNARLYVDNGEVATRTARKFKSFNDLAKWAMAVMSR